jgi:hypothetical protein
VTLGDDAGHQLRLVTRDASAPTNPDVSVFAMALAAHVEIVHPLTAEPWGVTRFFYRSWVNETSSRDPDISEHSYRADTRVDEDSFAPWTEAGAGANGSPPLQLHGPQPERVRDDADRR